MTTATYVFSNDSLDFDSKLGVRVRPTCVDANGEPAEVEFDPACTLKGAGKYLGFASAEDAREFLSGSGESGVYYHTKGKRHLIPVDWVGDGEPIRPRLGSATVQKLPPSVPLTGSDIYRQLHS